MKQEQQWYEFYGNNLESIYGYGYPLEAVTYRDYLNETQESNEYQLRELGNDEDTNTKLSSRNDSLQLSDALEAIRIDQE